MALVKYHFIKLAILEVWLKKKSYTHELTCVCKLLDRQWLLRATIPLLSIRHCTATPRGASSPTNSAFFPSKGASVKCLNAAVNSWIPYVHEQPNGYCGPNYSYSWVHLFQCLWSIIKMLTIWKRFCTWIVFKIALCNTVVITANYICCTLFNAHKRYNLKCTSIYYNKWTSNRHFQDFMSVEKLSHMLSLY